MKRYELKKEQWDRIKQMLPPEETGKRERPHILLDGGASTELYGNDFYAHTTIQHKIPQMISVGQA